MVVKMNKDLFSKNIENIVKLMKNQTYTATQLNKLHSKLKQNRYIAQAMPFTTFLQKLIKLQKKQINITMNNKYLSIYSYDDEVSETKMLLGFRKKSFYSMSSVLNLLGLSDFRENFIFLSQELPNKNLQKNSLSQIAIDTAFSKKYRRTQMIGKYKEKNIIFLTPKYTNYYEIITDKEGNRFSSINRAFVEIIVNVQYFKNSLNIIELFKPIKNKLDVNTIYTVLAVFDFIYPYFQCIGFYLHKIGFKTEELQAFKSRVENLKFYTDKEQESYQYNEYWQMYHI